MLRAPPVKFTGPPRPRRQIPPGLRPPRGPAPSKASIPGGPRQNHKRLGPLHYPSMGRDDVFVSRSDIKPYGERNSVSDRPVYGATATSGRDAPTISPSSASAGASGLRWHRRSFDIGQPGIGPQPTCSWGPGALRIHHGAAVSLKRATLNDTNGCPQCLQNKASLSWPAARQFAHVRTGTISA